MLCILKMGTLWNMVRMLHSLSYIFITHNNKAETKETETIEFKIIIYEKCDWKFGTWYICHLISVKTETSTK